MCSVSKWVQSLINDPEVVTANRFIRLRRLILLLMIGCAILCLVLILLTDWKPIVWMLQLQSLGHSYIKEQPLLCALAFVAVCAFTLSCGIPGGALLALTGGFLFGFAVGVFLTLLGMTLSAVVVWWLVVRGSYNPELENRKAWFATQIGHHPLAFPLLIRMIPVFPFFWLNLAFSLIRQPFAYYMTSACLGALPGVLALALLGDSTQQWVDGEQLSLSLLLAQPSFIAAWFVLGGLALAGYCCRRRVKGG